MNYAILRVQKLKTNTAVRGSLKHAFRDQNTPNAIDSLKGENSHIGASSVEEAMGNFKGRLPEKVRKNGVRCVEYLMTASPEKMDSMTREQQDGYFSASLEWLKDKHGAENVIYSGIHRDEKTPHLYAYVVPLSQERGEDGAIKRPGKLNCREFLGGSKNVLSELQDEFANKVGKKYAMDRGVKGSKARHTRISEYYKNVNESTVEAVKADTLSPNILTPKHTGTKMMKIVNTFEKGEQVAERVFGEANDKIETLQKEANKSLQHMNDSRLDSERKTRSLERELGSMSEIRSLDAKSKKRLNEAARKIKLQQAQERKAQRSSKGRDD